MEDNKRLAYAIFLSILAVFIYTQLFAPLPVKEVIVEKKAPEKRVATKSELTTTPVNENAVVDNIKNAYAKKTSKTPTLKDYENSSRIRIENNLFKTEITFLGGRMASLELKKHKVKLNESENYNLVNTKGADLPLGISVTGFNDSGVTYNVLGISKNLQNSKGVYIVDSVDEFSFKLEGTLPNGNKIEKIFKFFPNKYDFKLSVKLEKETTDGSLLLLEWPTYHPLEETAKRYNPLMVEQLNLENSIKREALPDLTNNQQRLSAKWFGIGDNYFATYLVPSVKDEFNGKVIREDDNVILQALGSTSGGDFAVFTGAKEYDILKNSEYGFGRSIDLGWFGFIGQPILTCIKILNNLLGNYGLAIVLFTILLKALLLPFTKTSFVSMQKMQDLQPEMKKLREETKDQTKLQQEMMALYKKHKVNPLGGCLPMLAQVPIFLGMYNALRVSIDLRHSPFALWINDLAAPERLDMFGIAVPVMILLMGASMFVQQFTIPSSADPAQRKMMLLMPIVFTIMFVIFPFPAGLVLYWLVNNLISITQQMALRTEKRITPFQATGVAGVAIFGMAFILTLL